MRQLKAEYYKMKYSRASKWVLVFMAFIFFIPFVVGNDTLFMTFGDYRNIDSIGWICYIDDMVCSRLTIRMAVPTPMQRLIRRNIWSSVINP